MKFHLRRDTLDSPIGADDAGDVRPVAVAVVWNRIGRDDGAEVVAIEGIADE